jgi:hypothetical protein
MSMEEVAQPVAVELASTLQEQLTTATEEIQNLTQQLNCLLALTKK